MKFLSTFIIIIQFLLDPITAAAISAREPLETICVTGCIPSTDEDWGQTYGARIGPDPKPASLSSGAVCQFLSSTGRISSTTKAPRRSILPMTPAKSQGYVASCTAFAVASCIEFLVPELTVSEAELFLRMATIGKTGRFNSGVSLINYVALLREGVVQAKEFIPYDKFEKYVIKREYLAELGQLSCSEVLAVSDDFQDSVQDILKDQDLAPDTVTNPVWRIKPFHVKYRGYVNCLYREGYWRKERFNCFPLKIGGSPVNGRRMNPDTLNYFKHILNSVPIVTCIATFTTNDESYYEEESPRQREKREKFYYKNANKESLIIDDVWGKTPKGRGLLEERGYVIDTPKGIPELFSQGDINAQAAEIARALQTETEKPPTKSNGWHAICLCGYDDSIAGGNGAFRIKNSWSFWNRTTGKYSLYADNGFAWISYDYLARYIGDAMVILTHPRDIYVDRDLLTSTIDDRKDYTTPYIRSIEYHTQADYRASAAFEAMLAAYNERKTRR